MTESDSHSSEAEIPAETLKKALKAFKKRLKLARLDDVSLGGGAFSGGERGLTAVAPPDQYPTEVWEELARQGKIKNAGYGLYELVKHHPDHH